MTDFLTSPTYVQVPYRTDGGIGPKAHIGMIITSNDQTLPTEARRMLAIPGVALDEARLLSTRPRDGELAVDALAQLAERIVGSARQINTIHPPDVVAVGCTSGAMVIGRQRLTEQIGEVYPGAVVTDPLSGLQIALRALETMRVGFISPYPRQVAEMMISRLHEAGIEVPVAGTFHKDSASVSADAPFISPDSIAKAALEIGRSEGVDAVLVACTQMRAAEILERVEAELGKPVVTSNQALCWHALRLTGYNTPVDGWGRLFRVAEA
jgi:maleate isomerase